MKTFKEGENLRFLRKYQHGLVITIYALIYFLLFQYIEQRPIYQYHVIHAVFDDYIPFCEYFIIPYLLWFPYMFGAVAYFIFWNDNKQEYYQLTKNLIMGMTIFLIVSFVYPNGHLLRPTSFAHDNIFVHAVQWLYAADTPTNILPSIHVFNSLAVHKAITSCQRLKKHRLIQAASWVLTILIILSTMFLKQHSFVDVAAGIALSLIMYVVTYHTGWKKLFQRTPLRILVS